MFVCALRWGGGGGGGDFVQDGLCPCCKIHGGGGGGGGIMSTYTNLSRGLGVIVWGILSYTEPLRSQTF